MTESVTFRNGVSLLDRTIIINLLEGVKFRDQVPNFVKLITFRTLLSRAAIQNRIKVGRILVRAQKFPDLALIYRKGLVSHSLILRQINKLDNNEKLIL